jgi:hypothetical protein
VQRAEFGITAGAGDAGYFDPIAERAAHADVRIFSGPEELELFLAKNAKHQPSAA